MQMEKLVTNIEAIIFSTDQPVTAREIRDCLGKYLEAEVQLKEVEYYLDELMAKYNTDDYAMHIVKIAGGYQFLTKTAHHKLLSVYHHLKQNRKLSSAALETLAVIAYRQPVEKADIEHIRGVNCDYTIHKLLEKELITILGRSEGPGRPMLYGTSELFMEYFGINSVNDLPKLKEFQPADENAIGNPEFEFKEN